MPLPNSFTSYQENHFLRWNGDIADPLLLVSLEGYEALSAPFCYELRSLTKKSEGDLTQWHGKTVSCRIGDGSCPLRIMLANSMPHNSRINANTKPWYK